MSQHNQPPGMKSWDEIQYAHDTLESMFEHFSDTIDDLPDVERIPLMKTRDTLCWVLSHQSLGVEGIEFLIKACTEALRMSGVELVKPEALN